MSTSMREAVGEDEEDGEREEKSSSSFTDVVMVVGGEEVVARSLPAIKPSDGLNSPFFLDARAMRQHSRARLLLFQSDGA